MDLKKLLDSLIPQLGQAGVDALEGVLTDLAADQDTPWKATVLHLVADAVDQHGPQGVELARKAVEALFNNEVPQIDWANPRTASDIVAQLQNAEADDQSAARDFFVKIGQAISQITVGLFKGLAAN